MNQAVITYGGFATKHKVTLASEQVDQNPFVDGDGTFGTLLHWKVKVKRGRRSMFLYFSKEAEPTISEVLCCLAIDAITADSVSSFKGWADEFGFDLDNPQAKQTYKACSKQTADLKRLLGDDLYTALLTAEEDDE